MAQVALKRDVMMMFLFIALGGALGAVSRYAIGLAITAQFGAGFMPLATLSVHVVGSALMGFCFACLGTGLALSDPMRGFVMVGFLGALTTFSSFSLDTIALIEKGQVLVGLGYIIGSVLLSLMAFVVVMAITRHMITGH